MALLRLLTLRGILPIFFPRNLSSIEMKIVSLNVSLPRTIRWRGESVTTGIYKEPVSRPLRLAVLNLEGDAQADLSVHGGPDKAVYAYAAEYYPLWQKELFRDDLGFGMFGENLTVDGGLFEEAVCVGDRFSAGAAELVAVQPRLPCYKLGIRFGTQRIIKKFAVARRYGVYFRVVKEGVVAPNDPFVKTGESGSGISIRDVGRLLLEGSNDAALIARAAGAEFLPERLRDHFRSLLEEKE